MGAWVGRRRTLVVIAAVVALIAAGCSWGQYGYDASRASYSPNETALTVANVGGLAPLWQATAGAPIGNLIADGSLFAISTSTGLDHQKLFAYSADGSKGCSGTPRICAPQWTTPLSVALTAPDTIFGGFAVSGGRVYVAGVVPVAGSPWRLEVFDSQGQQGCSGTPKTCAPLWTATWGSGLSSGLGPTLAIAGGRVYVSTPKGPDAVTVFDAAGVSGCTTGSRVTCSPLFATADQSGGPIAVSGGRLFDTENFGTQVFDATGVTGCTNKICSRLWVLDMAFPSISGTTAYNVGGAFDLTSTTDCPLGCEPTWRYRGAVTPLALAPAVAAGRVFVAASVNATPFGVDAFDASGQSCTGSPRTCAPLARLLTVGEPEGVAATASLVFVSTANTFNGGGATISAFDLAGAAACSGTPKTCQPLRSIVLPVSVGFPGRPSVANGLVAVSGDAGGINVFALPK